MSTHEDTQSTGHQPDLEELQVAIEQTREELAETVDALAAKLDVKARTKARIETTKQETVTRLAKERARASQLVAQARSAATDDRGRRTVPVLVGVGTATAGVVLVTALVFWRKRS